MVAAVALIAAAFGPRIPSRFVISIARLIQGRGASSDYRATVDGNNIWFLRAVRDRDEALLWLSLAVLSSLAGLIGILTLPLVSLFESLHSQLLANFFWTRLTLSGVEWTGLVLLTGGMWLINGLLVAALAPVIGARTGTRHEQPGIAAGLLLGLGLALYLHRPLADHGLSGSQEFLLGALPMFALSVLGVLLSHRAEARPPLHLPDETSAPELTGKAEGWIWISLAAWATGAALAASGWLQCESISSNYFRSMGFGLGAYFLTVGLGVSFASLARARTNPWISECGTALWAAGITTGAAAVAVAFLPTGRGFSFLQLVVLALPLGYALHHAERAWLARAGSETLGFAQMTTAILAGAAIGIIASRWWIEPALGPLGTLTTGGLVLMAFGGLNQIHEEDSTSGTNRRRLGLVFASLAAAIVLFPTSTEKWSRWSQSLSRMDAPHISSFITQEELPRLHRICVIGLHPLSTIPGLDNYSGLIDWVVPEGDRSIPNEELPPRTRLVNPHNFRMIQLDRTHYELIYQHGQHPEGNARFAEYSLEWFTSLTACLAGGGRLIVDVPLVGQTTDSIRIIASTMANATQSTIMWRVIDVPDDRVLRLLVSSELPDSPSTTKTGAWRPVTCLFDSADQTVPLHSLRRDRLTAAMRDANDDPQVVLDWLDGRHKSCNN